MKSLIFIFLFLGSILGGYLPLLWGGSLFSVSSVIWSGVGGILGIYIGYMLNQRIG